MYVIHGSVFIALGVVCYVIGRSIYVGMRYKRFKQIKWFREIVSLLFAIYMCMVVSVTLFPLPIGLSSNIEHVHRLINVKPLVTIINNISQIGTAYDGDVMFMTGLIVRNVGGNILLLMPLGFLAPILWEKVRRFKNMLICAFIVSMSIELLQFIELLAGGYGRVSDIDDVICNVFGAIVGFLMFKLAYRIANRFRMDHVFMEG